MGSGAGAPVAGAPAVKAAGLTIAYDRQPVVYGLDLTVDAGETVALLGPSGSGKSTILAAIAGFRAPLAGELRLAGRLVADGRGVAVPPEERSVGMVFQSDALWPHLSVLDTVVYPIRRRGVGREAAAHEAGLLLERLGIAALAHRRPAQLSGGEQQRTGLARALARGAAVYLLDEPTAHLDAALKATLQVEMADQCRATGAAVVVATHDVAEALAVADRVALVREGRLVQAAPPLEVYERPVDVWAAHLTGIASVLRGDLDGRLQAAGPAAVVVRPDWVSLGGDRPGLVAAVRFRGSHTDTTLETPFGPLVVRSLGGPSVAVGATATWTLHRWWPLPG